MKQLANLVGGYLTGLHRTLKTEKLSVTYRLEREIRKRTGECSTSTTENRTTAVNALRRFISEKYPNTLITAGGISADHMRAFVDWMKGKGYKPRYIRCQVANLRSVLNLVNGRGTKICRGLQYGKPNHVMTALSRETVQELASLQLTDERLIRTRCFFFFCTLAQGMAPIDAAHLKKSDIVNGFITYCRHKTNMPVTVEITPALRMLLDQLPPGKGEYLLPILDDSGDTERQYKNFLPRYNRQLRKLSGLVGEDIRLSSYVARHTWASIADAIGGEIESISKCLGHASTKVTAAYIDNITNRGAVQLNRDVAGHLFPDSVGLKTA